MSRLLVSSEYYLYAVPQRTRNLGNTIGAFHSTPVNDASPEQATCVACKMLKNQLHRQLPHSGIDRCSADDAKRRRTVGSIRV